jgi:hypothetical protein
VKLYHYTCSHRIDAIRTSRWLIPNSQLQLPGKPELVWLTDLDMPDHLGLGLTSYSLKCDRTEHRITAVVAEHEAVHWPRYARSLTREARATVEDCDGVLPMHWWVAAVPVPVFDIEAVAR